jgi:hypothetical protein
VACSKYGSDESGRGDLREVFGGHAVRNGSPTTMIMLIIVLLLLALVNAKPVLAFGEDRLFRILHLTDLHFGED